MKHAVKRISDDLRALQCESCNGIENLTHGLSWGKNHRFDIVQLNKMDDILQTSFEYAFPWRKIIVYMEKLPASLHNASAMHGFELCFILHPSYQEPFR